MSRRFHPGCFKCAQCGLLLEHIAFHERDGLAYCHVDFHEVRTACDQIECRAQPRRSCSQSVATTARRPLSTSLT
jgi:hypothetical protein